MIGVIIIIKITRAGTRQHPPAAACSSFRWRPCLVVGTPVVLAILDFAPDIPNALFVENPLTNTIPPYLINSHPGEFSRGWQIEHNIV